MEPDFEIMDIGENAYPFSCHLEFSGVKGFSIAPHYHYEIELLFFYSGRAQVYVGSRLFEVCANDMVLVNAMEVHSISVQPDSDVRYIVVMFNPSLLPTSSGVSFESKYITPFTMKGSSLRRFYSAQDLRDTTVPGQFGAIWEEFQGRRYGFEFAIRLGIYGIILWILRQNDTLSAQEGLVLSKEQALRFKKLLEYVEDHFSEEIGAGTVVDICHIDYSYFARQFRRITGRTFREYLNYVRISQAERLLLTTNMPVTGIALAVGYTDTSYFIKQFKREKGVSPTQIRKIINRETLG